MQQCNISTSRKLLAQCQRLYGCVLVSHVLHVVDQPFDSLVGEFWLLTQTITPRPGLEDAFFDIQRNAESFSREALYTCTGQSRDHVLNVETGGLQV